jgi:hypothetical protein
MNYIDFTVTGFLSDASFREWVLSPDTANRLYWEDWCRKHPSQQEEIALARQLVEMQPDFLPEDRVDSLWAAIEAEMGAAPAAPLKPPGPAADKGGKAGGSLMSAVFWGLLVAGLALYWKSNRLTKSL